MPSVAEELAALRKKGSTRKFSEKLQSTAGSLSTPEQEEANLKKKAERERVSNYKKEAVATLNAGTKEIDQDLKFKTQQNTQKKQQQAKKKEAETTLHSFNSKKEKFVGNATTVAPTTTTTYAATKKKNDIPKVKSTEPETTKKQNAVDSNSSKKKEQKENNNAPVTIATNATTSSKDVEDNDDVPELEEQPTTVPETVPEVTAPPPPPQPQQQQQNRAEKKSRKMMQRLGMRQITDIVRATLKTPGQGSGYFAIDNPDVFEKNGTYVIFGEARQGGNLQQQASRQQAQAAQQFVSPTDGGDAAAATEIPSLAADEPSVSNVTTATDDAVDETGVDSNDVELVMSQASCSRSKAVIALKENDNDLVNAIMSLTT
mmetsp:Transcript_9937/g.15314  ORF Transcript_9937/g.15314 Transcript_9937/m.15314 type:complete len:374 (-) Transcript_9937:76-1197(-)|eukprot:CAMPEP_0195292420 /NCGR_PEP_ID=MMETSP0707-20130614/9448_1 /TAXON_ID=33640 /ORGANISM="Asterionellopsis glacialis, Strain CCMP134" /LENGTH=373 /DNA_ID=CAMNT_0040352883 /DNA_START=62 /DNA_END=1183 /DNA_ORIENTATION=-